MAKSWLVALAAAALLGGCAERPAAPVRTGANGVSRPATTAELFDGSYQGRSVLVRNTDLACPIWPRHGVVEIGDAVLTFPYRPDLTLTAPVAADGSVHAEIRNAVLDGQIVGRRLWFTIRTPECEAQYSLHFVWNHS